MIFSHKYSKRFFICRNSDRQKRNDKSMFTKKRFPKLYCHTVWGYLLYKSMLLLSLEEAYVCGVGVNQICRMIRMGCRNFFTEFLAESKKDGYTINICLCVICMRGW